MYCKTYKIIAHNVWRALNKTKITKCSIKQIMYNALVELCPFPYTNMCVTVYAADPYPQRKCVQFVVYLFIAY